MSSSSRLTRSVAVMVSVVVRGGFGRIGIGWRKVGKGARARPRRVVDAIADDRPIPGVDQLREERVHRVVVQCPSAAGLVYLPAAGGEFDLEERALLGVGLGDVDDEEVRE